jgi:hypothetical protein
MASQRPLPDNTQHSQETDIHALGGFRTRNPSKWAAADLRLRPCGHWDRPTFQLPSSIIKRNARYKFSTSSLPSEDLVPCGWSQTNVRWKYDLQKCVVSSLTAFNCKVTRLPKKLFSRNHFHAAWNWSCVKLALWLPILRKTKCLHWISSNYDYEITVISGIKLPVSYNCNFMLHVTSCLKRVSCARCPVVANHEKNCACGDRGC